MESRAPPQAAPEEAPLEAARDGLSAEVSVDVEVCPAPSQSQGEEPLPETQPLRMDRVSETPEDPKDALERAETELRELLEAMRIQKEECTALKLRLANAGTVAQDARAKAAHLEGMLETAEAALAKEKEAVAELEAVGKEAAKRERKSTQAAQDRLEAAQAQEARTREALGEELAQERRHSARRKL